MITVYWCECLLNGKWEAFIGLDDEKDAVEWQQRMEYGWGRYEWELEEVRAYPDDGDWHCLPARVRMELVEE